MSEQSPENIQFYISEESPCPYLPEFNERKIFTHLFGKRAELLMQALSEHGFRRSQNIVYRPVCKNCSACKPVRIIVPQFLPSQSQRRIIKKNKDIVVTKKAAIATKEQYELFKRYLNGRHVDGNMAEMTYQDYVFMIEDSPVSSMIIEYRLNDKDNVLGSLIGVALCDIMQNAISMIYSFFDIYYQSRSLGKFMILDNIERVRMMKLNYLHLGYWVHGSKKMHYKVEFKPLEYVNGESGWQALELIDL